MKSQILTPSSLKIVTAAFFRWDLHKNAGVTSRREPFHYKDPKVDFPT